MRLKELQEHFRSWLTSASDSAAERLGKDRSGLHVYQNNYRAQLIGCLQQSYPQLRAWIGDEAFLHAAAKHIERQPPHAWTLDAYGAEFDGTLLALFPDNPDMHQLAWIEWALGAAFVAPDAAPLALAGLADIDWESARLTFSPSLRLAPLTTNAADIWWAMNDGAARIDGQMLEAAGGVMVWRRGYVSCLRALDAIEYSALTQLQADGSFADLCALLVDRLGEEQGTTKAGSLLAEWVGAELITGVTDAGHLIPSSEQGTINHD